MAEIRLEQKVDVPVALAFEALGTVLAGIARQETMWQGFALHVDLGDVGLPDVGYIAIPIALTLHDATPGINQHNVTIRAAEHPESFPVFEGAIGADMAGRTGSMLWLMGSYNVPLGSVGAIVNASLARGVAQKALHNLLGDLANASKAHIEKREAEFIRFRLRV